MKYQHSIFDKQRKKYSKYLRYNHKMGDYVFIQFLINSQHLYVKKEIQLEGGVNGWAIFGEPKYEISNK